MSGFFIIFWDFFKVDSGVFLYSRVATLHRNSVGLVWLMTIHMVGIVCNQTYSSYVILILLLLSGRPVTTQAFCYYQCSQFVLCRYYYVFNKLHA